MLQDQHYLTIDVVDTTRVTMDNFSLSLIANFTSQAVILYGSRSSNPATLWLIYKLDCAINWYGSNCSTFCLAQDTLIPPAHYTCNTTAGHKICKEFYENPEQNCSVSKELNIIIYL
jgi:hypothetical protein